MAVALGVVGLALLQAELDAAALKLARHDTNLDVVSGAALRGDRRSHDRASEDDRYAHSGDTDPQPAAGLWPGPAKGSRRLTINRPLGSPGSHYRKRWNPKPQQSMHRLASSEYVDAQDA